MDRISKKIANVFLYRLDHHVWVWQGGAREFDLNELFALLRRVSDQDPVPTFTQNLFLRIGSDAETLIAHSSEIISVDQNLKEAMTELCQLSGIRDNGKLMSPSVIASYVSKSAEFLAKAAKLQLQTRSELTGEELRYHDPSVKAQESRHFGRD